MVCRGANKNMAYGSLLVQVVTPKDGIIWPVVNAISNQKTILPSVLKLEAILNLLD